MQKKCASYYKGDPDLVQFGEKYKGNVTYLDKLKVSRSGTRAEIIILGATLDFWLAFKKNILNPVKVYETSYSRNLSSVEKYLSFTLFYFNEPVDNNCVVASVSKIIKTVDGTIIY